MVYLHCQHGRTWNHLGDTPQACLVKVFSRDLTGIGRPTVTVADHFKGQGPRLTKVVLSTSIQLALCFLPVDAP